MKGLDPDKVMHRRGWGVPRRLVAGRALRQAATLVPLILAELSDLSGTLEDWVVSAASWTITGTATFLVGLPGRPPQGVLRMSSTGGRRLQHETAVLTALAEIPDLTDVRRLIPNRRAEGLIQGWRYVLDDYLDGRDAPHALAATPGLRAAVELSGAAAVTALHRATARPTTVDDEMLRRWVDEPVQILSRGLRQVTLRAAPRGLDAIQARLRESLRGREVQSGWIHGDFWLGNIRVDPVSGTATGIIDWDCAGRDELPAHDLLHLALYGLSIERGVSLGALVAEVVASGTWPARSEEILRYGRWSWDEGLADADVALLYWLRYVSMMMVQQRDYVDHSIVMWEWRNIARVLRSV